MSEIEPFLRQGNNTQIDNAVFDILMPTLSPTEWKVLCLILRKTIGWQKTKDSISYSQIKRGTGIRSPATVSKALSKLESIQIIVSVRTAEKWESNIYCLNRHYKISNSKNESSSKNELEPNSKNELEPNSKNEHTKETGKEKEKNILPDNGKHLSLQQEMFGAICFVLKRNYKVRKKQTANFASQFIELGITPDEIKKFYGPDGWWYLVDWRGRQNQLPNEGAILDTFEAAREYYVVSSDEGGVGGSVLELEDYFTEITGILPHPGGRSRQDDWTRPCQSFLKKAGDLEKAKKLMDASFEIIRSSGKYRFSTPLSLLTTAMNLHAENGNGSAAKAVGDSIGGFYT